MQQAAQKCVEVVAEGSKRSRSGSSLCVHWTVTRMYKMPYNLCDGDTLYSYSSYYG